VSTRRLFFALWPSPDEQRALAHQFRDPIAAAGGRAIASSNLHATLAFLGSVPEEALLTVSAIALKVSDATRRDTPPIEIVFDGVEYWRKPQILCATASATPAAASELAERLKRALTDAQFAPDLKAFRAHITLARKVRRVEPWSASPMSLIFRDFSLVESRSESHGSTYSVIESWPLCAR